MTKPFYQTISGHDRFIKVVSNILVFSLVVILVSPADAAPPFEMKAPLDIAGDIQIPKGIAVRFDAMAYEQLRGRRTVHLTDFPLRPNQKVDLDLEQFEVTTPSTVVVAGTEQGDVPIPHPQVVLLKGKISGQQDSEVVIGISPHGSNGYIRRSDELYFLSPGRTTKNGPKFSYHTIAEKAETAGRKPAGQFQCYARPNPDRSAVPETYVRTSDVEAQDFSYPWRVAFVAIECDNEYLDHFGGDLDAALAYVLQLSGTVSSFYERDMNIKWYLSYIRVWVSTDPYPSLETPATFDHFAYYWQVNMDHVERDLAQMYSCKPWRMGLGIVQSLCNDNWHYSVCTGLQGWFPRPVQNLNGDNWDLHVAAHEAGHTFGSQHTHCYDPPIDNCADAGADVNNEACVERTVFNECVPGTLMSYCGSDFCGGYANELMSFHPRVIECIRNYVTATACLRQGLNPVYVDWRYTGLENGSVTQPFNTVEEAIQVVIPDGTVAMYGGSYPETLTLNRPVVLVPSSGTVTIGQ